MILDYSPLPIESVENIQELTYEIDLLTSPDNRSNVCLNNKQIGRRVRRLSARITELSKRRATYEF